MYHLYDHFTYEQISREMPRKFVPGPQQGRKLNQSLNPGNLHLFFDKFIGIHNSHNITGPFKIYKSMVLVNS